MSLKVWGKSACIVCIGVIIDVMVHQIAPQITASAQSGTSGAIVLSPSLIVRLGLFAPVFLIFALVTFGLFAAVFIYLQVNLPQSHWMKGVWYGLAFGGLWYIGMLEASLVLGTPIKQELFMGVADALPILVMGVLLGGFVSTTQNSHSRSRSSRANTIAILCIALCYIVGRYFAYGILHIDSAYISNPLGTFLWTLGMGVWVGIVYCLLESGLRSTFPLYRAIIFSCVIYGIDWFMFTFTMPLLFEMNLLDILLRLIVDVLSVMIGVFFAEILIRRHLIMSTSSGTKVHDNYKAG